MTRLTRRQFLHQSARASLFTAVCVEAISRPAQLRAAAQPELPAVDFHVHLDNSTIDKVLELSRERGIKFGIVEHAGTKANQYPTLLSDDTDLRRYLSMLEGKPVFKGLQAEWTDWMSCFSRETLGKLDFILSDAMTFPGKNGTRVKLWTAQAAEQVDLTNRQAFMDRFVDWHVEVMAREPIDILANTAWLPAGMLEQWDLYWTEPRMQKVIAAARQHGVALEISASYKLPRLPFLKLAKAAGVKLSFGSNGRYPNMGKLDYCFEVSRLLGLRPADMFSPAPHGCRAGQRGTQT
jgi:hypothetical protein